jgi:hypothetical protein
MNNVYAFPPIEAPKPDEFAAFMKVINVLADAKAARALAEKLQTAAAEHRDAAAKAAEMLAEAERQREILLSFLKAPMRRFTKPQTKRCAGLSLKSKITRHRLPIGFGNWKSAKRRQRPSMRLPLLFTKTSSGASHSSSRPRRNGSPLSRSPGAR